MAVKNEEELREWLETQSPDFNRLFAWRAAMRVLPLAAHLSNTEMDDSLALFLFRMAIKCGVACLFDKKVVSMHDPTLDNDYWSKAAIGGDWKPADYPSGMALSSMETAFQVSITGEIGDIALRDADRATVSIGVDLPDGELGWPNDLLRSIYQAAFGASGGIPDTNRSYEELRADAITVSDQAASAIRSYLQGKQSVLTAGGPWTFWARWYNRAMAGDPLPWALQEQIALIPDDIWTAGPGAAAEEIARIEAEFALRERIEEFEVTPSRVIQSRLGIGGNLPPEDIDDPHVATQVTIIWDTVRGIKEELTAENPFRERVARLIETLRSALVAVIQWFGRKSDLIVDMTIKWGIPAGGGYLVLNPGKAQAVLKAAQVWLPFLAP